MIEINIQMRKRKEGKDTKHATCLDGVEIAILQWVARVSWQNLQPHEWIGKS
jgi:hypothetical protein